MKTVLFSLLLLLLPLQADAERILALSPHVCEILSAIGAEDEIVGVVEYCDYPDSLAQLPHVGGHNRIQVESAMSLKPTLAVVMNDGTKAVKKLRKLGVHVIASNPTNLGDMLIEVKRMGSLSGHTEQAEVLVKQLKQRLEEMEAFKTKRPIPVFYEIWP
ncbi:MAG: helical backbone metal receptor, partial [Mariprofundaceae bacterium]